MSKLTGAKVAGIAGKRQAVLALPMGDLEYWERRLGVKPKANSPSVPPGLGASSSQPAPTCSQASSSTSRSPPVLPPSCPALPKRPAKKAEATGPTMKAGEGSQKRKDQPQVHHFRRGDPGLALGAALTNETKAQALADLRANYYSAGGGGPRSACWNSWARFHAAWFGDDAPPLPLTPESVESVAAMFRQGRYRTYRNYVTRASDAHVEAGFLLDPRLKRIIKLTTRAVERGQGPPARAATFDLFAVAARQLGPDPVVEDGPVFPGVVLVGGALFMMREVELSNMEVADVVVDRATKKVILTLPASKTDTRGHGVKRAWGCVCGGRVEQPCAYCGFERVEAWHRLRGSRPHDPFFCTQEGRRITKTAVLDTILAVVLGEVTPGISQEADEELSGHSCRVAGAQHMAILGMEVALSQLMGRWGSMEVLVYVREAPLTAITEEYRARVDASSLRSLYSKAVSLPTVPGASGLALAALEERLNDTAADLGMLRSMVSDDIDGIKKLLGHLHVAAKVYVKMPEGRKWHDVAVGFPAPPSEWKTRCGQSFFGAGMTSSEVWHEPMCKACLRLRSKQAHTAAIADDRESSSSEGS